MAGKKRLSPREKASREAAKQLAAIVASIDTIEAALKGLKLQVREMHSRQAELRYQEAEPTTPES